MVDAGTKAFEVKGPKPPSALSHVSAPKVSTVRRIWLSSEATNPLRRMVTPKAKPTAKAKAKPAAKKAAPAKSKSKPKVKAKPKAKPKAKAPAKKKKR